MSRSDDDDGALIVTLDPNGRTEERVSVSDLVPDQHQPVVCTYLPRSGARDNLISCLVEQVMINFWVQNTSLGAVGSMNLDTMRSRNLPIHTTKIQNQRYVETTVARPPSPKGGWE